LSLLTAPARRVVRHAVVGPAGLQGYLTIHIDDANNNNNKWKKRTIS
jgi:hypothetical protein